MFSSPTIQLSESPRDTTELTPASEPKKQCLSPQAKLLVGSLVCIILVLTSVCLILALKDTSVDSTQIQEEYIQDADELHIGEFSICHWERVPVAESVLVNGEEMTFSTPLIEGEICETGELVLLVLDSNNGVHGSIGSTHVVAETSTTSSFVEENLEDLPAYDESPDVEAWAEQFKHDQAKWADAHGRRRRQLLNPGSVDVHLHLDLDGHMVNRLGSYGAAEYAVELIAVMNRDVYFPLGFNLKVTSINLRSSYVSQTESTIAYLHVIQGEGMPDNANLVHSLTTRPLGGGVAYLGGLYYPDGYGYAVSGSLNGDFHYWDLVVVAHELGHNFGAEHTHDMSPQVDNCGDVCFGGTDRTPQQGTIMSYCHICQGGLNNIDYVFHDRVKEVILATYDQNEWRLPTTRECIELSSTIPDVGVPFYLKTDQCLNLPNTNPELCELDSAWVKDRQSGAFRLMSASNRNQCWEASCGSNSVGLMSCSSSSNAQLFEFVGSQLRSVACGSAVTGTSNSLFTMGSGSALQQWCSPDNNPGAPDAGCENTNNGLTDPWGDDCDWYDENPDGCGQYDGNGFRSNDMCCACGGGRRLTAEPTTPSPTMVSVEPTMAVPCEDTDNGATDSWGDDCAWYDDHPNGCGQYDDDDFTASEMCCTCGGGRPVNPTTPSPSFATPSPSMTPAPTASPPTDFCYISPCGCAPFQNSWCEEGTHHMQGWCAQSEFNCQTCLGVWCPNDATPSPTMATPSPTMATPNPTTRSPTGTDVPETTTETPTTMSPTTETPTTMSPTTQTPTTMSPTTQTPTTMSPTTMTPTTMTPTEDASGYLDVDLGDGRTCANSQRIGRLCRSGSQTPVCSLSDCQAGCDARANCAFLYLNNAGNCHLYSACGRLRTPGMPGVTQQKLAGGNFISTTDASTTESV